MDSGITVFLAGAAGAAIIKMVDNVIQFFLARKAKREDDKQKEEQADKKASLDDVLNEIASLKEMLSKEANVTERQGNALRVFMYDKIDYLSNRFIEEQSVPLGIRKDVDILYRSYKDDLEANGDLAAQMELFYSLPIRPSHGRTENGNIKNE